MEGEGGISVCFVCFLIHDFFHAGLAIYFNMTYTKITQPTQGTAQFFSERDETGGES
jgi:hypothetical protein